MLVVGGSGEYFDVADAVICMDCYKPQDVTAQARDISRRFAAAAGPGTGAQHGGEGYAGCIPRTITTLHSPHLAGGGGGGWKGQRDLRPKTRTLHTIHFDSEELDLRWWGGGEGGGAPLYTRRSPVLSTGLG